MLLTYEYQVLGSGFPGTSTLRVDARVTTSGPRNAFPLTVPGLRLSLAQRLRFIAGIGITPILPMLAHTESLGVDWSMIYTGRSLDSLPLRHEVARIGDRVEIRTDDVHGVPTAANYWEPARDGTIGARLRTRRC